MKIMQHLGLLGIGAAFTVLVSIHCIAGPTTVPLTPNKWGSWQTNDKLDSVLYRIAPVQAGIRKGSYFLNYPEVDISTNCFVLDDFNPTLTYPLSNSQMFVNSWVDQPVLINHMADGYSTYSVDWVKPSEDDEDSMIMSLTAMPYNSSDPAEKKVFLIEFRIEE